MKVTDPRSKNTWFDLADIQHYLRDYAEAVKEAVSKVDGPSLQKACDLICDTAKSGGQIYVAGNGGSAAISDHLCCDFVKGTHVSGHAPIRVVSLAANMSFLTAVANDFGYEETFAFQVGTLAKKGDVLILISSSGNSENILKALMQAKKQSIPVIGLTGFTGGRLANEADISLHVPFHNYGVVEDAHQMLMHVIAQFIVGNREGE